jgi:hypothetical protein
MPAKAAAPGACHPGNSVACSTPRTFQFSLFVARLIHGRMHLSSKIAADFSENRGPKRPVEIVFSQIPAVAETAD